MTQDFIDGYMEALDDLDALIQGKLSQSVPGVTQCLDLLHEYQDRMRRFVELPPYFSEPINGGEGRP